MQRQPKQSQQSPIASFILVQRRLRCLTAFRIEDPFSAELDALKPPDRSIIRENVGPHRAQKLTCSQLRLSGFLEWVDAEGGQFAIYEANNAASTHNAYPIIVI